MARGWESKAVEDQIEDQKMRQQSGGARAALLTEAERLRDDRLKSLKLSRARTLEQLERATHQAHRATLQNSLRALELQIEELERKDQA